MVWVSRIELQGSSLRTNFTRYLDEQARGDPIGTDEKRSPPDKMYYRNPDANEENPLRYLFDAHGNWIVSEECKSVLERFDLGNSSFHPVTFYRTDRVSKYEGQYFCFDIVSQKSAFLVAESKPQQKYLHEDRLRLNFGLQDDDLAISQSALEGADLWIDPGLSRALFLSDRLVSTLLAESMQRLWKLNRCRID